MAKRLLMIGTLAIALHATDALGQTAAGNARNYFVTTNNVKPKAQKAPAVDEDGEAAAEEEQKKDFIGRNFRYVSMCDWQPGTRFMCLPTQKDMVIKTFTEASTGNLVSSRKLARKVMIYDGHANTTGSLHEHVNFHLEENPNEAYYFEVPTGTFDDYCFSQTGMPTLAYLGDVDMAQDSLVGKKVRVLVRELYQDSDNDGSGSKPVDIGDEGRGSVMTITKVGVGTRDFPVKIVVKAPGHNGQEGQEYFQNVAISRTNCSYRSDQLEVSDLLPHTFEGSFQLLDDRMPVSSELQTWVGKKVYTFFDTKMRNSKEQTVKLTRLSTFEVTDIFRIGDSNQVTLTLKGLKTGESYTKEVAVENTKVVGSDEVLDRLFVEGDPEKIENVRQQNLPFIQKRQVKKGFTEAEVRLALGEPTDINRITADTYQWTYQFKEDSSRPFRVVKFSYRTKRVTPDMTR